MLVGRDAELARLDRLLDDVRGGDSRSMIVHGDAGIGKTALLDDVVGRAADLTVLRSSPLDAEAELAFAGLSDLLRPLLPLLGRIPETQAAVLAGALALGPPTAGDRFTAAVATISLLAAAGEERPVLVVVDDAHWLDAPSREALLFAARRLVSDRVMLLLGMRDRPWRATSGIEQLEVRGLLPLAAVDYIGGLGRIVVAEVREQLVQGTGGNPLAMREAVSILADEQLAGSVPITGPIAVGSALEGTFGIRLDQLPDESRRALVIAATSNSGGIAEIRQALCWAGIDPGVLEIAERRHLIEARGDVFEFEHPLLRSATYHLADPVERRRAHRALAEVLTPDRSDQIAWHLAAAALGPDEAVAQRLEQAASVAQSRHGYAAAARAMTTAATLSPEPADWARRMLFAGNAFRLGGEALAANDVLVQLLDRLTDPIVRADVQLLRGSALLTCWPLADVTSLLVAEAERIEAHDPIRAATMLSMATISASGAADIRRGVEVAERALQLSRPAGGPSHMVAQLGCCFAFSMAGRVAETRALLAPLLPVLDLIDPVGETGLVLATASHVMVWIEDWAHARLILDRFVATARSAGAITMLPHPLSVLAELELRSGHIAASYAAAAEAVQISADIGEVVQHSIALVCLARVEALLGRSDECRLHAEEAIGQASRLGVAAVFDYAAAALGLLELSLGRADLAVTHLEVCSAQERDVGVRLPNAVMWNGDLVESYVRLGRRADAERETQMLAEQADATGIRWAAAIAARCRGLLADEHHFEVAFRQAIDQHGDDDPYERARTRLCLGRRLRHSRRRAEARAELRLALEDLEALGAVSWADQARAELRATGSKVDPSSSGSVTSLTAQELHVALVVAGGATNKEVSVALFISPKTVEFHLSNVYRKLGLRSRTELARRFSGRG